MHQPFREYVQNWKEIALNKEINWDFKLDGEGVSDTGWNLTSFVNGIAPPVHYLKDFGGDAKCIAIMNKEEISGQAILTKKPLDMHWQELIKASTIEHLFYKRSSALHIVNGIIRPLKVLATYCTFLSVKPWELTPEIIDKVADIALKIQPSAQLKDVIIGITKNIFDTNHLTINCPIFPHLISKRINNGRDRRSKIVKSKTELLADLSQRKNQTKLPEKRAFWELLRIIFTEKPASYKDALRFAALKVMVITGLRVGEVVRLPADWKRTREYYDPHGKPAGELGGYSSSLLLRHFAEKQQSEMSDSVALSENTQYVPEMFQEILTEVLEEMLKITQPLRNTLKLQCESGTLFPWYHQSQNIPVTELYTRLTGNPFWLKIDESESNQFINHYRKTFNPAELVELNKHQKLIYDIGASYTLNMAMYMFFNRLVKDKKNKNPIHFRHANGAIYNKKRFKWSEVCLNIGELESYQIENLPTKISDTKPIKLTDGELQPWELLFLLPKRALSEERNSGIVDISRYYSVGIPDTTLMTSALGESEHFESIFSRYGETAEDQSLILTSHSLRHLQNTELFRLGVADTIITKRFNRKSVTQSYVYDHRSLSELLESVELPIEVEAMLGVKSSTVAKMIKMGKASGPIVEEFKRIEKEQGEQAAFDYLKVEADGFHATPYGHCINSFTVDPCPKHLECFAGCRHLTATNLPHQIENLKKLERKFEVAIAEIQSRPATTIGHENQFTHATVRLESIRKLLQTPNGQTVFPNGEDFSVVNKPRSII
ncbi:MAG: hypothetical protein SFU55_00575 [Methylophilus sp.]|nr:hypothetical protein [Methylophilus sp.]